MSHDPPEPKRKIELRLLDSLNHLVSIEIECDAGMVEWRVEQVKGIFGERLVGYVEREMEKEEVASNESG